MEQKGTKGPSMEGMEETARPQSIQPFAQRFIAIRAHQLPPNPYRGDSDAGAHHHHHHPIVNAAPTIGEESTNTREEKGSAPSSRPSQNIAEENQHIPCGPPVHWKKRVFEASSTGEELGEEARKKKKRATIWHEGQLGEGVEVNRDTRQQGGLGGQNPAEMDKENEQPLQTRVWGWSQEGDDGSGRYAYTENAGPSNQQQHMHTERQHLRAVGGQQHVWSQEYEDYRRIPERKMLPGPSDGTAMGELLKRIGIQRRIEAARKENVAWKYYDEAKADQSHPQGSPQSRDFNDEEFLVAAEGFLLCEACLKEVAPLERSFHVGLRSHMMKVQCMKEELAWFEDV